MVNIIKVQCPHCGVEGRLVLPDDETIVVGPCPQCHESLLLFAGHVLPLNTKIMEHGQPPEVYEHLYGALISFIRGELDRLFKKLGKDFQVIEEVPETITEEDFDDTEDSEEESDRDLAISRKEMEEFIQEELPLLDDADYFKTIFG
ncbi:MAG: hypothetical protein GX117_14085 [Candidatus Hydrogenedentes bacterium]|jgi:Zn-finger nucleic acid-binding protein|nr:hypothetical protein [Candidatus Hydrogenedentota bacterium]